MKEKILITGAAGMIGSVLSKHFLGKGYSVVGIDNLSGGFMENLPSEMSFLKADIREDKIIDKIFQKENPEVVIHCAAYAAEILSPFVRNFNYSNNLLGSVNIINASINNGVRKIINFSSIATYGEGCPPFKETDLRQPKDCYGIAKLAVEMDLEEARRHFGLEYSTVLPHNVVSIYQNYWDKYRNVIAIWINQIANWNTVCIFGDGTQTRAFSDCKFLCAPIERLLTEYSGESFNIGSDETISIKEAAEITLRIGKLFGFSSDISYLPPRLEVKHSNSDHSKVKKLLGFNDKTDLESLIYSMYQRYLLLGKRDPTPAPIYEIEKNMYESWKL